MAPLTACGSSNTPAATQQTPTASPPTASRNSPAGASRAGANLVSAIAVCHAPVNLFFLEADTGRLLRKQPGPATVAGSTTTGSGAARFEPTGGNGTCDGLSYNSSLTRLAGINTYASGDTVPASLDLLTGDVNELAPPNDHSGFGRTDSKTTLLAEYNPQSNDLWYLERVDDNHVRIVGPNFSKRYTYDEAFTVAPGNQNPYSFIFTGESAPPRLLVNDFSSMTTKPSGDLLLPDGSVRRDQTQLDLPGKFMDRDKLPQTDYFVERIRFADNRSTAAFVAYNAGKPSLWMVPATGGSPRKLVDLANLGTPAGTRFGVARVGRLPSQADGAG